MSSKLESVICSCCNGSGEGMYDGSTCRACKGTGEQACLVWEQDDNETNWDEEE